MSVTIRKKSFSGGLYNKVIEHSSINCERIELQRIADLMKEEQNKREKISALAATWEEIKHKADDDPLLGVLLDGAIIDILNQIEALEVAAAKVAGKIRLAENKRLHIRGTRWIISEQDGHSQSR